MSNNIDYVLHPRHIFGINNNVTQNVHFIDDSNVAYSAGNHVVLLNLETKVQRLIPIGQQRVGRSGEVSNGLVHELQDHPSIDTASSKEEPTLVSIMALSNDRQFLAIGSHSARNEVADGPRDSPVIAIWDMVSLKRRKTLVVPDIGPKTIASLSFSSDGLFLLAMTSAPDFSMYVWNWERGKLQGQLRFGQLGQDLAAAQKLDSSAHDVETFAVPVMRRRASSIVANGHPVAGPSNEGPRLSIPTKTGDALHSVSPSTDRNGSVKHANQANSIVHNASRRGSQTNGNIPKLNRRASVVANTGTVVVNEQVRVDEAIEIVQASFVPFDGEFYQICITGNFIFRLLRFSPEVPNGLRFSGQVQNQFKKFERHCCIGHDRIILTTADGKLFFTENGDMKGEIAVNLETLAIPDKNVSVVENDGGIGKAAKNQHLLAVAEEKPGQSRVPSLADLRGRSNSTKLTRATSQMMNVGDLRISCILAFDGGFVIGTSQGKVAIFAPETEVKQTVFKQLRQWSVDYNVMVDNADHTTFAVQNMCLSPTEDNLLLQQGNSRLFFSDFGSPIASVLSPEFLAHDVEFKSVPFGYHGHCGVVREVSVCFRKPIVASCSSDRSVKIWNYLDLTLDVSKTFPDAPVSLSLHATGNFVLVGFSNAIRMFCVCADGLKMMWEVPMRSCQRVAFSNGGQFFVAACDCTLYLYDAWTQDLLGKVDAHNADVCRLLWADRDASLLSVGTDGLGIEWELVNNPIHFVVRQSDIAPNETMNDASGLDNSAAATAKRAAAVINSGELPYPMLFKQLRYFTTTNGITNTAEYFTLPAPPKDTVDQLAQKQKAEAAKTVEERLIDGSPPACMTLAFGTDGVLCASISGKDSDAQFVYQLTSEMTSAFLHASKNTLLTTTSTGNICSVRWPLLDADGLPLPNIDYVEYCGHRGNANNVVATRDGKNVISCGEDGCLILYEVTSRAEGYGPSKTPRSLKFGEMSSLDVMYTDTYTDDVLVGVEDYTERLQQTEDLLERERSTKEKHAISLIGKENVLNERMRATIAEHDEQIAELKKLVATIQADKDESKKCSHAKLEELHKKNKDDVMDAVNSFQLRIEEEQHKFDALRFHLQTKETNVKQRLEELSTKHVRVLEELQASYEQRLGVLESQHQDISDEISSLKHKHITYDQDMEEMLSDEISDICYKYEVQLKQERDTTAANQRDLDATRATFEALRTTISENGRVVLARQEVLRGLQSNANRVQQECDALRRDIGDKECEEVTRDKIIQDERRRQQDIEKAKFIMENRIITERERFEPREKLRMSLAHQLKAMRAEQELMRNDRKQSRLEERRLTSRFKCMQQQIMRERLRVCGFRIAMELVAEEMHEILNNFGGEEFSGTLSLVGEASDRANVDEESQLASGNVHQHHSERNFKMETRLKKELISFYHRQCRDEGASAAIAEPKGYVQSAKPLEDPIIVKVMNLPYVVEELMKGQSNHDSALEVSTAKRKGVEGKKTPSATSVKDLIKSVGSASLAELLAGSRMSMYAASSSASISLDGDVNQQQSSEKLSQDDAADMDSTNTDNAGSTDIHGSFASIHAFNNNNNDAQDNLIRTILQSKLNIKRNPFDESTHHAAVVDQLMQSSRSQADRDTNFARKEMRRLLAEQQLLRTDLNAARAEVMLQKEKMRKIPDSERRNTLPPIVRSRL